MENRAKPYLYVATPDGKLHLAVSDSVTLAEPTEYVPEPTSSPWDEFHDHEGFFDHDYREEEAAGKRKKVLLTFITIDIFCTIALASMASYDYFHDSDSLDRDFYTLHMVYCALNLVNDFIGLVAVWRASLMGLSLFLTCELLMTIFSTVASFSPLVLFHLLILLLTIQNRMYISRMRMLQGIGEVIV